MGPNRGNGWIWPSSAPFNIRLESLAIVAAEYGYTPCDNGEPEDDYEKIVLYGDEERIDHATSQLRNGRWTSKLGYQGEDIQHDTPEVVTGGEYGPVVAFFRRAIEKSQP